MLVNGYGVSVCRDENALKLGSGDGYYILMYIYMYK